MAMYFSHHNSEQAIRSEKFSSLFIVTYDERCANTQFIYTVLFILFAMIWSVILSVLCGNPMWPWFLRHHNACAFHRNICPLVLKDGCWMQERHVPLQVNTTSALLAADSLQLASSYH